MNRINLSQLNKCDQVWEEMTPNERGRMCEKCSKTIVDFRNLSDREVAEIHMFSDGPVCGIYNRKQLKAPSKESLKKKPLKWASLYVGLGGFLFANPAVGQEAADTVKVVQTEKNYENLEEQEQSRSFHGKVLSKDAIIISGQLVDEQDVPIPFATVLLKNTTTGVTTNYDGHYSLNISTVQIPWPYSFPMSDMVVKRSVL